MPNVVQDSDSVCVVTLGVAGGSKIICVNLWTTNKLLLNQQADDRNCLWFVFTT